MASEIRVNSITNRSGLGTVTFSDTGVVLSGVSTFTVSAGSASAPSISPSGDSNTGIFFPSPDTIAFSEGGIEALRIDSSANIGIGTTNPRGKFEVVGNIIADGFDIRSLSGTHLVSYASASDISNSSLSISGISSYIQVGIITVSSNLDDGFGNTLAMSADGKTIVAARSYGELSGAASNSGVVYVFDRVGNSFNQVGILTGSYAIDSDDNFGAEKIDISADGKTIFICAAADELPGSGNSSGLVYVFDRVGNSFNQVGILTGSNASDASDLFGYSVTTSADGKTVVVGAVSDEVPGPTSSYGVVYVFDRVGNSFNQVGILTGSYASNSGDSFGQSVAVSDDGKTIVVAALVDEVPGPTSSYGVVYVFDRVGNSFNQVGILTGSYASGTFDYFGSSLSCSGDGKTVVVGAVSDELPGTTDTGLVYVFDRVGSSFNQVGILTGSNASNSGDLFGQSVAVSANGKTIVVGAPGDELSGSTGNGVAYVFNRQKDTFNQVGILTGSYADSLFDYFGSALSISADGKTIVVSATGDEVPGSSNGSGVVYVFDEVRDTYLYSGSTGNIGINSTSPARKLDVVDSGANGSVIRSRVTTNNGGYLAYEALNSSGTSVFSVTHNGRINLSENIVFASGQGIDFSATANSSGTMTSELLNDYEEGTWTPTTNSPGGVSFTGTARYIKIGKQVTINVERLIFPSTTNATTLALSGLPFACESSNNGNAALITTNANVLRALVVGGTSNIYFYPDASVNATNITNGTGSDIYALQLTYFVS